MKIRAGSTSASPPAKRNASGELASVVNTCAGTIMRTLKTGGAPVTVATGQSAPQGIAVHDGYVYWANSSAGTIMAAKACAGTPASVYTGGTNPQTLVTDGTQLFWNDFTGNSVMAVP